VTLNFDPLNWRLAHRLRFIEIVHTNFVLYKKALSGKTNRQGDEQHAYTALRHAKLPHRKRHQLTSKRQVLDKRLETVFNFRIARLPHDKELNKSVCDLSLSIVVVAFPLRGISGSRARSSSVQYCSYPPLSVDVVAGEVLLGTWALNSVDRGGPGDADDRSSRQHDQRHLHDCCLPAANAAAAAATEIATSRGANSFLLGCMCRRQTKVTDTNATVYCVCVNRRPTRWSRKEAYKPLCSCHKRLIRVKGSSLFTILPT